MLGDEHVVRARRAFRQRFDFRVVGAPHLVLVVEVAHLGSEAEQREAVDVQVDLPRHELRPCVVDQHLVLAGVGATALAVADLRDVLALPPLFVQVPHFGLHWHGRLRFSALLGTEYRPFEPVLPAPFAPCACDESRLKRHQFPSAEVGHGLHMLFRANPTALHSREGAPSRVVPPPRSNAPGCLFPQGRWPPLAWRLGVRRGHFCARSPLRVVRDRPCRKQALLASSTMAPWPCSKQLGARGAPREEASARMVGAACYIGSRMQVSLGAPPSGASDVRSQFRIPLPA